MAERKPLAQQFGSMLEPYKGQSLVGVVDGWDCVEIIFSERKGNTNMLTLWFDDDDGGVTYAHGGVAQPEVYVDACGVGQ